MRNAIRTCRSISLLLSSLLSCSSLVHLLFSFLSKGLDLKIIDRRSPLHGHSSGNRGSTNDSELEGAERAGGWIVHPARNDTCKQFLCDVHRENHDLVNAMSLNPPPQVTNIKCESVHVCVGFWDDGELAIPSERL